MICIIISFIGLLLGSHLHDFHLSRVDISYRSERNEFQTSAHIFIDDLEEDIYRKSHVRLHIGTDRAIKNVDFYLEKYINTHLRIYDNNTQYYWSMVGYEISDDLQAVWIYAEMQLGNESSEIIVKNTILNDLYEDQKNITEIRSEYNLVKYEILDLTNNYLVLQLR